MHRRPGRRLLELLVEAARVGLLPEGEELAARGVLAEGVGAQAPANEASPDGQMHMKKMPAGMKM